MMHIYSYTTQTAEETQSLAKNLAKQLHAGDVLALVGDLASGKTTFTQGLAQFYQIEEYASSPTFTYINEYRGRDQDLIHIDAYRLNGSEELISMGIWEYFESTSIIVIEWADIVADALPEDTIGIRFQTHDTNNNERQISIHSPRVLDLDL